MTLAHSFVTEISLLFLHYDNVISSSISRRFQWIKPDPQAAWHSEKFKIGFWKISWFNPLFFIIIDATACRYNQASLPSLSFFSLWMKHIFRVREQTNRFDINDVFLSDSELLSLLHFEGGEFSNAFIYFRETHNLFHPRRLSRYVSLVIAEQIEIHINKISCVF